MTAPERKPPDGWFLAYNSHTVACPGFGVVIVSTSTTRNNQVVLTVTRPTAVTEGMTKSVAVAWPAGIAAGGYGYVTTTWPTVCAYNTADTPANGELWGLAANSYLLAQGNNGMLALGGQVNSSPARAVFDHSGKYHKPMWLRCDLDSALAVTDQDTANFSVITRWDGVTSGVTDPTSIKNLSISSNYLFEGVTNAVFLAAYDWNTDTYTIVQMECPACS